MKYTQEFLYMQKLAGLITEGEYREKIEEEEDSSKKKLIILVGPPSVGKSTWIKSNFPQSYIINRDDIVEKVASNYGWTYDDMFSTPPPDAKIGDSDEKYGKVIKAPSDMPWAKTVFDKALKANSQVQKLMNSKVQGAVPSNKDIVVDMTNMNSGARKNALKSIEGNEDQYHAVAVDFKFKGAEDTIKKMASKRAEAAKRMGKSKTIPDAAFNRMFSSYEEPSKSEGFDEIISVNNIEKLKKSLT
jgi:tRNA uridine 5-carbamoylmethylation protein Kti12